MRTVFTLSLLAVVVASVASAAKFAPATEPKAEGARSLPSSAAVSAPVRKSAVEVRQAPVPLKWGYKHETVSVATEEAPTIADLTSKVMTDQAANAGEGSARAAIEADGYKAVRNLVRTPDGSWQGKAMRGRVEVAIRVNADGSVSAD